MKKQNTFHMRSLSLMQLAITLSPASRNSLISVVEKNSY